jgi:hypothetical protein
VWTLLGNTTHHGGVDDFTIQPEVHKASESLLDSGLSSITAAQSPVRRMSQPLQPLHEDPSRYLPGGIAAVQKHIRTGIAPHRNRLSEVVRATGKYI